MTGVLMETSQALIKNACIVLAHSSLIKALPVAAFSLVPSIIRAQAPQVPASSLTSRSITAIGYQLGAGSTMADLTGTGLIAELGGQAKVEARRGVTSIAVKITGLTSPTRLGTEFLTYALWAATPSIWAKCCTTAGVKASFKLKTTAELLIVRYRGTLCCRAEAERDAAREHARIPKDGSFR
jgi:hypothetical protein